MQGRIVLDDCNFNIFKRLNFLSVSFKEKVWAATMTGPFILNYVPDPEVHSETPRCPFSVIGWRSQNSLRLYIGKHDRVHFLHLIGESLPEWLQENY